jgi:hypothetical protein
MAVLKGLNGLNLESELEIEGDAVMFDFFF